MGLLSTPKDTLDYNVWEKETLKLRPIIKEQILKDSSKIVPAEAIKEIFIIGSVTGWKWDDESDIDVNLRVPEKYVTDEAQIKRKSINGKIAADTNHVINYFLQIYEEPANWQDAYFGVYDVLQDKWVSSPPERSKVRDPKQQFYLELISAYEILRNFRNMVNRWKRLQSIKNPNAHQQALEKRYFNEAREYAQFIDDERKLDYKYGWGIPRNNWRNVVYKLIEHSDVGEDFEWLKELK